MMASTMQFEAERYAAIACLHAIANENHARQNNQQSDKPWCETIALV
jgi:hypothetical protein